MSDTGRAEQERIFRPSRRAKSVPPETTGDFGPPTIEYSSSVLRATGKSAGMPVAANQLMATLCSEHKDYAQGLAGDLIPALQSLVSGSRKKPEVWMAEISTLFSPVAIKLLDTRMAMFGLALLDGTVFELFWHHRFFEALFPEMSPDFMRRPPPAA